MFRKIWNYLRHKCLILRPEKKRNSINLDIIAKDFVGQVFPPKSDTEKGDNLFEELDKNHFDALAKEPDPLDDTVEIPDDSITSSKADIPTVVSRPILGETNEFIKADVGVKSNKQGHIKRSDAQIRPDNQPFPPRKNQSVRGRRRS